MTHGYYAAVRIQFWRSGSSNWKGKRFISPGLTVQSLSGVNGFFSEPQLSLMQCFNVSGSVATGNRFFWRFPIFGSTWGKEKKKTSGMIFSEKAKLGGIAPPLASVDLRPGSDKGPDDWPMGGPVPPSLTWTRLSSSSRSPRLFSPPDLPTWTGSAGIFCARGCRSLGFDRFSAEACVHLWLVG